MQISNVFAANVYPSWVNFRAETVTNFVSKNIQTIRQKNDRQVVITLFIDPGKDGKLVSFDSIKQWNGADIKAMAALQPDAIEIQDLFLDFDYPQKPEWTASFIEQFKSMLGEGIPIMVSVQGFDSANAKLKPIDFAQAIKVAMDNGAQGVSFYAYHTIQEQHWKALADIWLR